MPPEFYKNHTFDKAGDWWALGCLVYEILTGNPPFFALDPKRLTQKIICKLPNKDIKLTDFIDTDPDYKVLSDIDAKSLIQGLLQKDPLKRQ